MTQTQAESAREQQLARWLIYAILVAPMIAIMSRDLGFHPVGSWIIYAIIAAPMIAMLAHREKMLIPSSGGSFTQSLH